jgi:streptomycin 6-kinase
MLKVAFNQEEREGAALMTWWNGDGAARVIASEAEALLLERAEGSGSLSTMSATGGDDEACRILCTTVGHLHASRGSPAPEVLAPLPVWFRQLEPAAAKHGGVLVMSARAARTLLATSCDERVLHGDVHHDNVLDFGDRGWLAIDPKALHGERAFDYLNLFCNPWPVAKTPGLLRRRLGIVASAADLNPDRLLMWVLAYAGLSAAWSIDDGGDPTNALEIAQIAAAEMGA